MLRCRAGPDEKLSSERLGEASAAIRQRVTAARERQAHRLCGTEVAHQC